MGGVWAVVPVKPFALAKQRLASALGPAERDLLARVMLHDVLSAIAASRRSLEGLLVVTPDDDVATVADRHGATVLRETRASGLNEALTLALGYLSNMGNPAMLVVPTDLPQLSADAINVAVTMLQAPRVVTLVRARDGGTNLFGCRPAGLIPPSFGPGSFESYCRAARIVGVEPTVVERPELDTDLDCESDLDAFLALGTPTATHAFLSDLSRREAQVLSRGMISRAIISI
jgi:2-phospho-L-lactate guanylyltransferase